MSAFLVGNYLVTVNVVQAIQQLLQDLFDITQAKLHVHIGQQTSQIVFTEIEYQVKGGPVIVAFICFGATYFD